MENIIMESINGKQRPLMHDRFGLQVGPHFSSTDDKTKRTEQDHTSVMIHIHLARAKCD